MGTTRIALIVGAVVAPLVATTAQPAEAVAMCGGRVATIVGTEGDDFLTGTDNPDVILALGGHDTINGGEQPDIICDGVGNDTVFGGSGGDRVVDGAGNDRLLLGIDTDIVDYTDAPNAVQVDLDLGQATGHGNDTLFDVEGAFGSPFDDRLLGSAGRDTLAGHFGDDIIRGGDGDDEIHGGAGDDLVEGEVGSDNLFGGGFFEDGSAAHDVVIGGPGDDSVAGGGGDSRLVGGPGNDRIRGRDTGFDTVDYSEAPASIQVSTFSNGFRVASGDGLDELHVGIDNVIGSAFDDVLRDGSAEGAAGDDLIVGGTFADRLVGGPGDDTLDGDDQFIASQDVVEGSEGDDILLTNQGDDTFIGGAGVDTLDFGESPQAVDVDLGAGTASGDGSDTIEQVERLVGTRFDDRLDGDADANFIDGFLGEDTINAGGGDDVALGGPVFPVEAGSRDHINGGAGDDVLDGNGTPFPFDAIDVINGGPGDDQLLGREGDDVLQGGLGDDRVDGGVGIDAASYETSGRRVTANIASGNGDRSRYRHAGARGGARRIATRRPAHRRRPRQPFGGPRRRRFAAQRGWQRPHRRRRGQRHRCRRSRR